MSKTVSVEGRRKDHQRRPRYKNKGPGSLKHQIVEKLNSLTRYGQSKHQEKKFQKAKAHAEGKHWNPSQTPGIFSGVTRHAYQRVAIQFARWEKEHHPEQRHLAQIPLAHVAEYIQERIDRGLSAWTINLDASALAKVMDCHLTDIPVIRPERRREDIKRSRGPVKDFCEKRHSDIVKFSKNCGMRAHKELAMVKPDNIFERDNHVYVKVENGKGGKSRITKVLEGSEQFFLDLRDRAQAEGREVLFFHIPCRAPIHAYRREYAQNLYREIEQKLANRDQETIREYNAAYAQWKERNSHGHRGMSDTIQCKDGTEWDRTICFMVSENLGHSREDVVVTNYLR